MKQALRWLASCLAILLASPVFGQDVVIGTMNSMASMADLEHILRTEAITWRSMHVAQGVITIQAPTSEQQRLRVALSRSPQFAQAVINTPHNPNTSKIDALPIGWYWRAASPSNSNTH